MLGHTHRAGTSGGSLFVEHFRHVGRHDDQRSTSVNSRSGVLQLQLFLSERDRLELELPVSLSSDGMVLDLSAVCRIIHTTESGLSSVFLRLAQSERKHGLVEELLVEHVVEGGNNVVDGDGVVCQSKDTVEFTKGKSESRLFGGFGKVLVLDGKVTDDDSVLRDETFEGTGSVSNGKLGSVGLVGGGSGRVVFRVQLGVSSDLVPLRSVTYGTETGFRIGSGRGVLTKQAMDEHEVPGTQRLDDPVSRTTLNS